jgi:acid phosphatase (class A)
MIYPRRFFLASCFAFSLAVPAFGAAPYVTAKMMDVATLMPPPPAKGSPADVADMRAVLDAQAHASEARKAQALVDSDENIYIIFTGVLGAKFVAADLPMASKLFERIGASEGARWMPPSRCSAGCAPGSPIPR